MNPTADDGRQQVGAHPFCAMPRDDLSLPVHSGGQPVNSPSWLQSDRGSAAANE